MSDEHRSDILGANDNNIVRTPYLDNIAENGTNFRNTYCNSPVCVPARQSFLTGKMPSTIDCLQFFDDFNSELLTFPGHFANHGYNTVSFGKMHFQDADQMHGWLQRPMGDLSNGNHASMSQGVQTRGYSPEERAAKGLGFWGPAKEVRNARGVNITDGPCGWDYLVTQGACHFLETYFADPWRDAPKSDIPLMFCLSLVAPHYPFQCPNELFEYYLNRVTPYLENAPSEHPAYQQYCAKITRDIRDVKDVSEREIQRATAAYYGQVEFMDTMFGMVIDKLKQLNVFDDFVVVYCSDHGDMLGQHGCWEKKQFYEGAVKAPLIISSPHHEHKSSSVEEVNSLLDVFPTLCDLAGLSTPDDLEGNSLMPLIGGETDGWKNEAVAELWGNWYHGGKGCFMIRRDKYKYIWYGDEKYPDQLFDLKSDPEEKNDLADSPEFSSMINEFQKEITDLWEKVPERKQKLKTI